MVKAWFIRGYMESQKSLGYWKGRNCNIGSMLRCGRKHYVGDILSCDDIRSPDTFIMSDKGGMFILGVFHMECQVKVEVKRLLVKTWFIRGYIESRKSLGYWKDRNYTLRWDK